MGAGVLFEPFLAPPREGSVSAEAIAVDCLSNVFDLAARDVYSSERDPDILHVCSLAPHLNHLAVGYPTRNEVDYSRRMVITRGRRTPESDAVLHYDSLLEKHGAVAMGVGWKNESAQNERFEQLCRILPREDSPLSLLDFGCGFGALAEYLAARRQNVMYHGYDASAAMIDRARDRVHDHRMQFDSDWQRVPRCDYTVASGIFNVRGDWSDDVWWNYVMETLRTIHEHTTRGWSANFLTTYSDPDLMRPDLFYANPGVVFDWCKRELSPLVALHHDYPLFDFTILVRKDTP